MKSLINVISGIGMLISGAIMQSSVTQTLYTAHSADYIARVGFVEAAMKNHTITFIVSIVLIVIGMIVTYCLYWCESFFTLQSLNCKKSEKSEMSRLRKHAF